MPMQIRRTATPDSPPTGLAQGQLSVEMASTPPRLWVGVPTGIDPSGRRLINSGTTTVSATAPANPQDGDFWYNTNADQLFVRRGALWLPTSRGTMTVSATQPASPQVGDLWYSTGTGHLLLWNGTDWVPTVYKIPGITDGSTAAVGEVGEGRIEQSSGTLIHNVTVSACNLLLPAGDWYIEGWMNWTFGGASPTDIDGNINGVSFGRKSGNTLPWTDQMVLSGSRRNITVSTNYTMGVWCLAPTATSATFIAQLVATRMR